MPEKYQVEIEVYPKEGMPDPRSSDDLRKVQALFPKSGVDNLRISKAIGFVVVAETGDEAIATTERLADDLLVQPVLEDYQITSIQLLDLNDS